MTKKILNIIRSIENKNPENNYILLDYSEFLKKENEYFKLAIDDENLHELTTIINKILNKYKNTKIMVCAYQKELIDANNKEFIYADSLLVVADITSDELYEMFEEYGNNILPSDISDSNEINKLIRKGLMFVDNSCNVNKIENILNDQEIKSIKIIYWD